MQQKRIESIDILRGIIIVLMALDHVRDYFSYNYDPLDLTTTTPAWFFTRWITHYCAPGFVFLAGISAYMYGKKVTRNQLSRFLLSRGIWLIFIEFTFVHFGWTLDVTTFYFVQVIWAIGWSMIVLAGLIYLPRWFIITFTTVLIFGHNLLDSVVIDAYWWQFLHQSRWSPPIIVAYPLIPWPAVMSLGFLVGELFIMEVAHRRKRLWLYGSLTILLFLILRWTNYYGDRSIWVDPERGPVYVLLSFLNTTKYPPSLLYITMTIGPSMIILAILENVSGWFSGFFQVFGRVPFFFYVLHIYVIHFTAIIYHGIRYDNWRTWFFAPPPEGYVPTLWITYVVWVIVILLMFFLCLWFGKVKRRYSNWWLKYL